MFNTILVEFCCVHAGCEPVQLQAIPFNHFLAINFTSEIDELALVLVELTGVDSLHCHVMFASGLPPFISHVRIIVVFSFTGPFGFCVIAGFEGESKTKLNYNCKISVCLDISNYRLSYQNFFSNVDC